MFDNAPLRIKTQQRGAMNTLLDLRPPATHTKMELPGQERALTLHQMLTHHKARLIKGGKALFTGARTTGSLKVSFFGPFYGGYHIAALDPNYRWALVLGSNTSYAWILARDKALSADTKAAVLRQATILGVKTEALIWVTHTRHDPNQP